MARNGDSAVFVSRFVHGKYAAPENLGGNVNVPAAFTVEAFIALDESYLLLGGWVWREPLGGIPSGDHPVAAPEDHRPGIHHRAKNLDPLFHGLSLEKGLCLDLGGTALLKENPRNKTVASLENE